MGELFYFGLGHITYRLGKCILLLKILRRDFNPTSHWLIGIFRILRWSYAFRQVRVYRRPKFVRGRLLSTII